LEGPQLLHGIATSVGDPDPEILTGSDPLKVLVTNQKVIFSHIHFHYFSFSANPEKTLRTYGQNYLKQRHFELFTKSGDFYTEA
jgi:hypothetical protein